jgi:hypothetical protein
MEARIPLGLPAKRRSVMEGKKIDGHRHVLFSEAVTLASKLDPVKSVNIYPSSINQESEEINRKKGAKWDRKMTDFDENVADLKAAGMDIGVVQPTQTMFFYWAESSAAAEFRNILWASLRYPFRMWSWRSRSLPMGSRSWD